MNQEEVFSVWAPQGSIWSRWVAPVLFAAPGAVPVLAGTDLGAMANGWTFDEVERVGNDLMITARLPHV